MNGLCASEIADEPGKGDAMTLPVETLRTTRPMQGPDEEAASQMGLTLRKNAPARLPVLPQKATDTIFKTGKDRDSARIVTGTYDAWTST